MSKLDTIVSKNELICVGNVPPLNNDKVHQRNFIYHEKGISPALCATDYKDPKRVLIKC